MKAILDFFRTNKTALLAVAASVGVIAGAMALTGCSLDTWIKHDVPKDMRGHNGGQPKVTLRESPNVMADYIDDVERNIRQFVESNEKALLFQDILNSALTVGIEELGNSPIPGATMISGLLLGLGGLMTKKPGTAKMVMEEKMASFNAGQEKTVAQMRQLDQIRDMFSPEAIREMVEKMKAGDA